MPFASSSQYIVDVYASLAASLPIDVQFTRICDRHLLDWEKTLSRLTDALLQESVRPIRDVVDMPNDLQIVTMKSSIPGSPSARKLQAETLDWLASQGLRQWGDVASFSVDDLRQRAGARDGLLREVLCGLLDAIAVALL